AYGKYASELEERLKSSGATVDSDFIAGGHDLGDADVPIIQKWLLNEAIGTMQALGGAVVLAGIMVARRG
ncbi:hypothetical protein ACC717_37735, partial [Rhizobium ruizarguesonis]